jgi:hypothetical protein
MTATLGDRKLLERDSKRILLIFKTHLPTYSLILNCAPFGFLDYLFVSRAACFLPYFLYKIQFDCVVVEVGKKRLL